MITEVDTGVELYMELVKRGFLFYTVFSIITVGFFGFLIFQEVIDDCAVAGAGTSLYVYPGGDSSGNYSKIQDAINASTNGDTIYVWAGTYFENIIVNKTVTIIGNGTINTTINGSGTGDVVHITADWVNISGFSVTNSGTILFPDYDSGIEISYAENVTIDNINCSRNYIGIRPDYSNCTTIINCTIGWNTREGINADDSHYNRIINNTCVYNSRWGMIYGRSNCNLIKNNNCSNNLMEGIEIWISSFNTIENNTCINNHAGITANRAINNKIVNNTCISNSYRGIYLVVSAMNNLIANNTCISNTLEDIHINSPSNTVINNTCKFGPLNSVGIRMASASSSIVRNNTCTNKSTGIWLQGAHNAIVENNNCSNNYHGIYDFYSNGVKITNNTCNSALYYDIYILSSNNNELSNNICSGGMYGVTIMTSRTLTMKNNTIVDYGMMIDGDLLEHWDTHNIDTSNTAAGKPIYYKKNTAGGTIPLGAGQIILADSSQVTIQNQNLSDVLMGIELGFSDNITIDKNEFYSNYYNGVYSYKSHWNVFSNNSCKLSGEGGFKLVESKSNRFTDNAMSYNRMGIYLRQYSNDNTIVENKCNSNYWDGISITERSDLNSVNNNTCYKNKKAGIRIDRSEENAVAFNICNWNTGDGVFLNFTNKVWAFNNTCSNNAIGIKNNGLAPWGWGKYNRIINNQCTLNYQIGIDMRGYNENIYANNTIQYNGLGFQIVADYNHIYHNSILNNDQQVTQNGINYWNNSKHEGNYWSDYSGLDDGSNGRVAGDGIGDTNIPHPGTGFDSYPFIRPLGWLYPGIPVLIGPVGICNNGNYSLIWTSVVKAQSYIIEEDEDIAFDSPSQIYNGSNLSLDFINKSEGIYFYRLKAMNGPYESIWSNIVEVIVDCLPPIPKNFQVSVYPFGNRLNLSWEPNSEDTEEYLLEYKTTGGWQLLEVLSHPTNSYNHVGLTDGQIHYYRICAQDSRDQNSEYSDTIQAIPKDSVAPATPTGLEGEALSDTEILLTWEANIEQDLEGYFVFMNDSSDIESGSFRLIGVVSSEDTFFEVTGLVEQTTYYFKLQAFDEVPNNSPFSELVNVTTPDIIPPQSPEGLEVINSTHNSLTLSWTPNPEPDVIGYIIYRSLSKFKQYNQITPEPLVNIPFTDSNLDDDTIYYYKLIAVDDANLTSYFSDFVSGKTLLNPYPPEINNSISDLRLPEDKYDDASINLFYWFKDVNNDPLTFGCEGQAHINVTIYQNNGTIGLLPEKDWNGDETLTFFASDGGANISDSITITITPVNDPPGPVTILSPENTIEIKEGDALDFSCSCPDPDLIYGDELTFIWSSDIAGDLGLGQSLNDIKLPVGEHIITVRASDKANKVAEAKIRIYVIEKSDGAGSLAETLGFQVAIGITIIVIILIILVFFFIVKKKKPVTTQGAPPITPPDQPTRPTTGTLPVHPGLSTLPPTPPPTYPSGLPPSLPYQPSPGYSYPAQAPGQAPPEPSEAQSTATNGILPPPKPPLLPPRAD